MGFAGSGISDEQDIFSLMDVLAPHQLSNQLLINGRLGLEIEGVDGLEHREASILDPSFGGPFLPRITSYNVCYTKLLRPRKHLPI